MHNSPVKTTARYLPGSPCYSQASEVAMEPEKKEDEENENKGEKENEENEDKEEEQEEEEQQPLEKPASKAKAGSKPKGAKDTTKDFQREKTEANGQSQRKCQGQKGEDTKGEERKEEQKGRHPCTFQKACCQRWYQRPSLQAPVWGARSERRG